MDADWLTLALGVLPAPPATLSATRAEGGEVPLDLIGHDQRGLLVRIDPVDAEETCAVTLALELPGRGEFAVVGTLAADDAGADTALLQIDEVLRWKRRPRVTLDVPATVVLVQGAAASERSAPVAVRVLDLAPQGVAFAAPDGFRRGDRLRLGTMVGERQLLVEPRVLQVGRPVFGRCRVSCTFAADPAVELVLAELADRAA